MNPLVSSLNASLDRCGIDTVPSGPPAELVEPVPPLGGSRPQNNSAHTPANVLRALGVLVDLNPIFLHSGIYTAVLLSLCCSHQAVSTLIPSLLLPVLLL